MPVDIEELPIPLEANQWPASEPSPSYLCDLAHRLLGRLDPLHRLRIAALVRSFGGTPFRIATACSGTELPMLAWRAVATAISVSLNVVFHVGHAYSCEKHPGKRKLIQTLFDDLPRMFGDAARLGHDMAHDYQRDEMAPIPAAECLIAGFPCTDASALNKQSWSQENSGCIASSSMRTGAAFAGLRAYAERHVSTLRFLVFENVVNLARGSKSSGTSNLDDAVGLLRAAGYHTKVWVLCPSYFGVPQRRRRLWFPAVPSYLLDELGLTPQQADEFLSMIMCSFVGCQQHSLDRYLLDEQDDLVQAYYQQLREQAASSSRTSNKCLPKWPEQHAQLQPDGDWWLSHAPDPSTLAAFPGLLALSDREFDILGFGGVSEFPERGITRVVEVSQSASRLARVHSDCSALITPSGRKYVTSRCRLLLGLEELRLQSIVYPPHQERMLRDIRLNTLTGDLAGNAMEGSCCVAVILACLTLLSTGMEVPMVPPSPSECMEADSDEDMDKDILAIWKPRLSRWVAPNEVDNASASSSSRASYI